MARAIAAFERTRVSGEAPIDRFLRGKEDALTPAQRRGWTLFNGKGRCNSCHAYNPTTPFFSDNRFHNMGVAAHKAGFRQLAAQARRHSSTNPKEIDRLAIETNAVRTRPLPGHPRTAQTSARSRLLSCAKSY